MTRRRFRRVVPLLSQARVVDATRHVLVMMHCQVVRNVVLTRSNIVNVDNEASKHHKGEESLHLEEAGNRHGV